MSNFTALNPEGYQKIMGRFSRKLARSFVEFTGSNAGAGVGVVLIHGLRLGRSTLSLLNITSKAAAAPKTDSYSAA